MGIFSLDYICGKGVPPVVDNTTTSMQDQSQTNDRQEIKYFNIASAHEYIQNLTDSILKKMKEEEHKEDKPLLSKILHNSLGLFSNQDVLPALIVALLRIAVIIALFIFLWRFSSRFIEHLLHRFLSKKQKDNSNHTSLIKTIVPILRSTCQWILTIITALLVLSEMNINVVPIFYSIGVLGLAVSIGAQDFVKDIINGFLTLFEGNMVVGDLVKIGEHKGIVESISLRCVYLRQKTGELHTIPFSKVNSIANYTRGYNVAPIQVLVAHHADIMAVERAMKETFALFKEDSNFSNYVTGDLKLIGVSSVNEHGMFVNCSFRIKPDSTKDYGAQFTKRLICELQQRNIPFSENKQS